MRTSSGAGGVDAFGSLEGALANVIFLVGVKHDEPAARAHGTAVLDLLEVRVNQLVLHSAG